MLEPVGGDPASQVGSTACHENNPVDLSKVGETVRQKEGVVLADMVAKQVTEHIGLLEDLLGHVMGVFAPSRIGGDGFSLPLRTIDRLAIPVGDLEFAAVDAGHVATFEMGDRIGMAGQGNLVGGNIHFAVSVADDQG